MSAELDKQVEALLECNPLEVPVVDTVGVQQLVCDLRLRLMALEKQNEALRQGGPNTGKSSGALDESEARFRSAVNTLLVGVVVHAADLTVLFSNPQACRLLGLTIEQMQGEQAIDPGWQFLYEDRSAVPFEDYPLARVIATGSSFTYECMGVQRPGHAEITWLTGSVVPIFSQENTLERIVVNFMDVTELKHLQQALQTRVLALTHPLDQPEGITFDALFNLAEIQRIQEDFSAATGVASIILDAEGDPITRPSNFVEFCKYLSADNAIEASDCFTPHPVIGRQGSHGPIIQQSPGSGLWDAAASIEVGGRHLATWLIGQVRDVSWPEEKVRTYARECGAAEQSVLEAFYRVPAMARGHFEKIAQAVFTLASQLSTAAYQNVQQARFIECQKKAELALQESEEKYRKLFELESDGIVIFDGETRQVVDVNEAATQLYGYSRAEFLQLNHAAITMNHALADESISALLAQGFIPLVSSHHRRKSGAVFPVEITAFSFSLRGRPVVCAVVRDSTERVAYEQEREKNRAELRKLASQLSLAAQCERERIGRELHDSVGQLLSSGLLRLSLLKGMPLPEKVFESLDTVCGIVEEALGETRSLTFELTCPMLSELGLAAALQELCSSMSHEHSIHFEFRGTLGLLSISMDSKIALYRSTLELMINVIRHSVATWACVSLEESEEYLRIRVEDNGVGFDAQKAGRGFSPSGGFGLFNIREYVRHVGGDLQIGSTSGSGTLVTLSVPLDMLHG